MTQESPQELVFLPPKAMLTPPSASQSKAEDPPTSPPSTPLMFDFFSSHSHIHNSTDVNSAGESPEANSENPSTALCLFDETWDWGKLTQEDSTVPCRPRNVLTQEARNIARMRTLSREDREEEKRNGVSTELTLFLDPWAIKQQLTSDDLSQLSLLGLRSDLVRDHIIRYLPEDDVRKVNGKAGLVVRVFDHNTVSTHQLVLKRRCTCGSYMLKDGWFKDFVCRRFLKKQDEVGFFWDRFASKLHFRLLSHAPADVQNQN